MFYRIPTGLSKSQCRMSSLQFNTRRPAHPVTQPFHALQEIPMYSITKILIGGIVALLLLIGEGALFVAGTAAAAELPAANLDRPAHSAYHQQLLGRTPLRAASIAQR
jgi:hypothetical protein